MVVEFNDRKSTSIKSFAVKKRNEIKKESRKKKLGYYEVENINNLCIITLVVNPKEYLEVFKDFKLNAKHKGIKKDRQD